MTRITATTFTSARAEALGQHEELHRLLQTGLVLAGAASRGDRPCREELPSFLELVLGKLNNHLAYEEETLVPLLAKAGQTGAAAGERILAEHQSQRRASWKLLQLAQASSDPTTVAAAFKHLHDEILGDIADEEKWLLEAGHSGQAHGGSS